MENNKYLSIQELATILGLSRIAVYKKVKSGKIKAVRVGRSYAIPRKNINQLLGKTLTEGQKHQIDAAVKKTIADYGEVLKLLGRE